MTKTKNEQPTSEQDGERHQSDPKDIRLPDPFDPEHLRLSQDFGAGLGVKKALITVPVNRPPNEYFLRTHPDEGYRLPTGMLQLKAEREMYLVAASLWDALATEPTFQSRLLVTTITRQGALYLWPLRLPRSDGRFDEWGRSETEAAEMARERWVRVSSNQSLGAYDVSYATTELPEPEWPDLPLKEILRIAFRDKFIETPDHPVLCRLRGEI